MRGGGGFRSTAMRGVMAMVMAKGLIVGSWWNENLIEGADWFVCRFLTWVFNHSSEFLPWHFFSLASPFSLLSLESGSIDRPHTYLGI